MATQFAEWKKEYEIGIPEVDEQHKGMIGIINDLHAGLSYDSTMDRTVTFKNSVRKVVDYVKNHFNTEEKYMKEMSFPELHQQQEMHKEFIVELLSNVKSYEYNNKRAPADLLLFLKDWLLEHIAIEDNKIGQFLKQQDKNTNGS